MLNKERRRDFPADQSQFRNADIWLELVVNRGDKNTVFKQHMHIGNLTMSDIWNLISDDAVRVGNSNALLEALRQAGESMAAGDRKPAALGIKGIKSIAVDDKEVSA